jgi:membrane protein required for colicin V production
VTGFDGILIVIILLSAVAAAAHGFFAEVISLGGTILGFILGAWQYARVATWFEPYVKSQPLANAAGFLTIVVAVGIFAGIAAKIATWTMKEAGLRWVDRFLGGAFGLVRGLVMATVVVLIATSFVPEANWLQRSHLAGYFTLSARVASWAAPASVRSKFQDGVAYLRKVRQEGLAKAEKTGSGESRHD